MASEESSTSHSSGLGVMPSMSAECTPLKHRYDACFNKWFEEYLGLPAASTSSSSTSSEADGRRDSGVSGFFSKVTSSSGSSSSSGGEASAGDRKRLRERLEGDCGSIWKEYQSCVLRAVKAKDLEGLIEEARGHNPFPFPNERKAKGPNNEPFPFPSASKDDTR